MSEPGVVSAHGPHMGCTFQKCGNPASDEPCPFVADVVGEGGKLGRPTYLPGQAVILHERGYHGRMAVMVGWAREQPDGTWIYRTLERDMQFVDEDVEQVL